MAIYTDFVYLLTMLHSYLNINGIRHTISQALSTSYMLMLLSNTELST